MADIELARGVERPSRRLVEARAPRITLEVPGDFEVMQLGYSAAHRVVNVEPPAFDVVIHVELAPGHTEIAWKLVLYVEVMQVRARV